MSLPKEVYLVLHECKHHWHASQSQVFNSTEDAMTVADEHLEWQKVGVDEEDIFCEYIEIVDALNGEVLCEVNKFRR